MPIAFPAGDRVVVLRKGHFHDCVTLSVGREVRVELDDRGVAVSIDGTVFHIYFDDIPVSLDDIAYVLVDPSQDHHQIIGLAEIDSFAEDQPGKVYLYR